MIQRMVGYLTAAFLTWSCAFAAEPQAPLRVFIRAGVKTHGPGEHDHPRFLAEWSELLKGRGCEVDGALDFPTPEQLARTDVLVLFAAEAGTMSPPQRESLAAFTARGGGIVTLHDGVCGKDPMWFKTVIGGAWEHGYSKWHHGVNGFYVQDTPHPITAGLSNFFVDDEIYWNLHLEPGAQVIGSSFRMFNEIAPQMWVYEREAYRSFVCLLGHRHATFSLPHVRALVLRGIAWAARREVDSLVNREELASLRYPPGGPLPLDKMAEKILVHPDFEIKAVLGEPDVVKPIAMNWDARGRLWVLQTPMYPAKAATWKTRPRDYLAYYEDQDGDGRPETRTVYYDQLDLPTSFVFHRDGVIVMASPEILWLRDVDGDGVADKREVLFSGFGFGDTHATASNLRAGQDGWIYATQGYSGGGSNVSNRDGKPCGKIPNGLFRFRPEGTEIEMVSAYGSNTWGMDFSWDNEIFFTMANGSHLRHVVLPEGVLARGKAGKVESWKDITNHRDAHPALKHTINPYLQIDNVGGFTAAAGSTLYDGGAWPDEWRKVHFVTECTINLVHQDRVEADGVTYKAHKVGSEEFVAGTDLWFRPIDTQIGPDGALWIADFYNPAVVHNDTRGPKHGPFNAAVRPDRDHLHGRILRLQHRQPRALPVSDFASVAGLVKALEHPNRWARLTAQRLLVEGGKGAAEVAALLKSTAKPETRVIALWTLQRLGALAAAELAAALGDADGAVRKNAARVAAVAAKDEGVKKALLEKLDDADPRARLEKIVALAAYPDAAAALLKLSPSLTDVYSRSAAVGALAAAPVESLLAAIDSGDKPLVEALAEQAGLRQDAELAARLVAGVAGKAGAEDLRAAALARLARALRPEVLPAARPELNAALEKLLSSGNAGLVSAAVPFAARWSSDGSLSKALEPVAAALLAGVADAKASEEARLQNLQAALSLPSARARAFEAAAALLSPAASAELQKGALEALGALSDPAVAPVLVGSYRRLAGLSRELLLGQIFKRPEWTLALVGELESGGLKPGDLGPGALFRLRTHPDRKVSEKSRALLDTLMGASAKAKDSIIARLLPEVEKAGDLARGKALLAENCLKCHQYKGEGRAIAPDLTGMGLHGKHDLLTHVVDPNRTVEGNYVSFNVRTKSGEVFNGLVARETNAGVVLKNNEGDKEIRRADIDAMISTGLSLMPEGLEALGAEALRDILSYLCADAGHFRVIDLQGAFTASTVRGLYDAVREPHNLRLRRFGITMVEGIPFQVVDPAKGLNGLNAVVLKGGMAPDWDSKQRMPRKVEFKVGFAAPRIHVLGGIAAWGTLEPEKSPEPIVKVTYRYADGQAETFVLHDAVEFSDWVRRVDVRGSRFVPDILEKGARGQVRWFTLRPRRKDAVIDRMTLESYDNTMAPTFLAMTADLGPEDQGVQAPPPPPPLQVPASGAVYVGGGASHDFNRWYRDVDAKLLDAAYTAAPAQLAAALKDVRLLVLSNNQPIPDPAARQGIFDHVAAGKGLLIIHPAAWYNWGDWKEYNRELVGGGARSHEKLQEFEVEAVAGSHAVLSGVPASFKVKDELYRFEKDPAGPEIEVLARGRSLETGKEWPVVWVVKHARARIVCITLGHDGAAHEHPAYQSLLRNAAAWVQGK
jgi:putative membrane-bound dehydrogenase-like protein